MEFKDKILLIIVSILLVSVYGYAGGFNGVGTNPNPEYHVSDSTFKMGSNWWTLVNSSSTNESVKFTNYYSENFGVLYEITLRLTQYSTNYQFESKYKNSSSLSDSYTVKTENTSISGIPVKFIHITDIKTNYTLQDYFFQKNGKYYSIHLDLRDYESYYNTEINYTITTIISTIY
ncbi:MAG: hypothetical protein ACC609_07110 [Methanobacterium formicicum]